MYVLYKSKNILTLVTIGYIVGFIVGMYIEYCLWTQEAVLNHKLLYWIVWDRFMQVLYLGRAPRTIHFFMLQYNLTPFSKSQYNIVLQYKLSPQAFFSAIQYSVLQYNFPLFSSILLCNTMTVLQYNFLYFKPSLQYNPAIQLSPLHCNTRNCIAI